MKSIALFIGSLILTIGVLELYLRFSEIETPSLIIVNDDIGVKYKPNKINATFLEGFALTKTNNSGYFFPNYEKKSDTAITISLISDSHINGLYVFERHHVRTLLENRLNKDTTINHSFRVLRFGQSGGNISDYYIWYKKQALEFNSDLSIILMNKDDFFFVKANPLLPHCMLENNQLVINSSFSQSSEYLFKKKLTNLSEFSTFRLALKCYKKRDDFKEIIFDLPPKQSNWEQPLYDTIKYLTPLNKKIILELAKGETIFIFKSETPQFIFDFFRKNNIPYYEMTSLFEEMRANGLDPTFWVGTNQHGHWNQKAQVVISKYLSELIIKYFINQEKDDKAKLLNSKENKTS